jgi:predicted RNase H-like HicB family nuclease
MNTVDFFGHKITKLIIGDNPINGHSYIEYKTTGKEMKSYYTAENVKAALKHLEEVGFNAMLPLADPYMTRVLNEYQQSGGNLKYIWQPYMPMDQRVSMRQMKEVNTIGIYHQGTTTDYLYEQGDIAKIKENIKMWRELGTPVGLASHYPEVIARCEDEDWGVDFYLASLHNSRRGRRGEPSGFLTGKTKSNISFHAIDRPLMLDVVKQIDKPVIAYKIFAGGQMFIGKTEEEKREMIKEVYEEVFTALKPNDLAAIGVFQRDMDEIKEDYDLYMEWYNSKNK